ncbi:MAG TPA: Ku protein [Gaiellaceae bacterium]|nr:Ku protein [Gaiellaceae bacterium]
MPRALWSGSIAFGLVNAPVRLYPAIAEHDLELHLVHVEDGSRIGYQKVCKAEGKPVPADEIAKAYEVEGELVLLDEADFEAAESEGYKTIEILAFVASDEIDPIYLDRSYYLGPQEGADKVYVLLREAMTRAGLSAVVRYVFHDREQLGALRVRGDTLVLSRLHYGDEVRPADEIAPGRGKVDERELELALDLIDRFAGRFEPDAYEDRYRARLLAIVEQKRTGGETTPARPEEPEETSDLLAALRESLERHTQDRPRGGEGSAREREALEALTAEELAERARELGIRGRSRMSKRELVRAVARAGR